jgi:phospholipid/cholesterol/gamma-HCH transport system ATP-binding protein
MGKDQPERMLTVQQLELRFGKTLILEGLDFTVQKGEIFAIIGRSGCGKSTLLRSLIGLHQPAGGEVYHEEQPMWACDSRQRRALQRRMGVLYQSSALWSSMTILENLLLPMRYFRRMPEKEMRELALEKLSQVQLEDAARRYPAELSGGMRKRAGLARALALDPPVVFLDEPQAGLDPVTAGQLDELLLSVRERSGTTMVMVTHELVSLYRTADRVLFLDAGLRRATACDRPQVLRDHPPNGRVGEFLAAGSVCIDSGKAAL